MWQWKDTVILKRNWFPSMGIGKALIRSISPYKKAAFVLCMHVVSRVLICFIPELRINGLFFSNQFQFVK